MNDGTLDVQAGLFSFSVGRAVDGLAGSGQFLGADGTTLRLGDVAAGATIDFDNVVLNADTLTIAGDFQARTSTSTVGVGEIAFTGTVQGVGSLLEINASDFNVGTNPISTTNLTLINPNASLHGTADVTVSGLLDWRDGTLSGSGAVHAQGGIRINDSGQRDLVLDGRTLNNVATAVWESGSVDLLNDALIHNLSGATFEAQHDGVLSGSGVFRNDGTFLKTGTTGGGTGLGTFVNDGTLDVQAGLFSFSVGRAVDGLAGSGQFLGADGTTLRINGVGDVAAGATIDFDNVVLNVGNVFDTLTIAGDFQARTSTSTVGVGEIAFTGTVQGVGSLLEINASDFNVGTNPISTTNLTLINPNASLHGTADVTVSGLLDWRDGTLSGSGAVHAQGGIRINDSGQRDLVLDGRTLNNVATAVWESGSVDLLNDALIHNLSGATFEAQHDGVLSGSGVFRNDGTFLKTGTTGGGTGLGTFVNDGTLDVQAGLFSFSVGRAVDGLAGSGQFLGADGTTLRINGVGDVAAGATIDFDNVVLNVGNVFDTLTIAGDFQARTSTSTVGVGEIAFTGTVQGVGSLLEINASDFNVGTNPISTTNLTLINPNASLHGTADVTVSGLLDWRDGTLSGSGAVHAQGGIRINDSGQRDLVLDGRTLNNVATAVWESGSVDLLNDALIHNLSGATFEAQHDGVLSGSGVFRNDGTFEIPSSVSGTVSIQPTTFENTGDVIVGGGSLSVSGFTQYGGTMQLNGGDVSGALLIAAGTLQGDGTVLGSVLTSGVTSPGFESPGLSFGLLETSQFTQGASGLLSVDIGGLVAGSGHDQLRVSGTVTLDGVLDVDLLSGFTPTVGDAITVIDNDGIDLISGTFDGLLEGATLPGLPWEISYVGGTGNDVVLTAIQTQAEIVGTEDNDTFLVESGSNPGEIVVTLTNSQGSVATQVTASQVALFGLGGDDTFTINHLPDGELILNGGAQDETFTINATTGGKISILGLGGNDAVTITATSANGATVDLGEGDDDYRVNFGQIQGDISLSDSGAAGTDELDVNGTGRPDRLEKTTGTITHEFMDDPDSPVATLAFDAIENVTVRGAAQNDLIIDPGTDTLLLGGPGDDTIIVNETFGNGVAVDGEEGADTIIIELGLLAGPVVVSDSGTSGLTTVQVQGTVGDDRMTLSATGLTAGHETVLFNFAAGETTLIVDGGEGEDLVTIEGPLPPGVTTELQSISQTVQIDAKPDSDVNTVNLLSNGVLPLVIFTTPGFDASTVSTGTVTFAGASVSHDALVDIDSDGDLDLVLHFRIQDMTDLEAAYRAALEDDLADNGILDDNHQLILLTLTGQTTSGTWIEGTDTIDAFLAGRAFKDVLETL